MRRKGTETVFVIIVTLIQITVGERNLGAELRDARQQREAIQQKLLLDRYQDSEYEDVEGLWPVNSVSSCKSVNTRDTGTDDEIARASKHSKLDSGPDCGVNKFMGRRRRDLTEPGNQEHIQSVGSESVERARRSSQEVKRRDKKWRADLRGANFLEKLKRMMVDYQQSLVKQKEEDGVGAIHQLRKRKLRSLDGLEDDLDLDTIVDDTMIDARVVGGTDSGEGKNPWLVSIGKKEKGLCCGGTLITDQWVLTAAHCFDDEEKLCKYNVRLGSFNWILDEDAVDLEPELVVRHRDFNEKTLENDIALVKLSKRVDLSADSAINAACLPQHKTPVGTPCVATGWGTVHEGDQEIPETAREVELPVMPDDECGFVISDKQLCAGYVEGGRDTCQGDSGGPLLLDDNDHWTLTGVTSYGNGCARAHWPGIYTDVSSYHDYIVSVINRY